MNGRNLAVAGAVVGALAATISAVRIGARRHATREVAPSVASAEAAPDASAPPESEDPRGRSFRMPTGHAAALTCEAARTIVAEARTQLGYAPDPVDPGALAEAAADWLDPYGLWSVAPDSPVSEMIDHRASGLLADLEGRSHGCEAARFIGEALSAWAGELRAVFDAARDATAADGDAAGGGEEDLATAASAAAFEGAAVTRPARALAATLGRRAGIVRHELGPSAQAYVDAARSRFFPELDASRWAEVVLAAAVRAYVPAIDPHGAWAPLDEESSVYEMDLEARPPDRLWDKAERTAIGIAVQSGAEPPLADGDIVLSLAGMPTAALSYEQMEQLGFAAEAVRPPAEAVVLRGDSRTPLHLTLDAAGQEAPAADDDGTQADDLPVERIEYGDADAIVVAIHDVRDDLGDELTRAILHEQAHGGRSIAGVVLDLRGNGGGSTDGAIDALGIFMPGAPLFPMRRRDGAIETDRAPEPPNVDRWRGPVAALVDGDTASAAEMIAGALAAYRRGVVVGATTFGKGCAQEYVDDDAHEGVLRLTTLLYALPDGTPVQRVGLTPAIRFPFGSVDATDRESSLPHAPPSWRGPDVRDRAIMAHAEDGAWTTSWPSNLGNVGPCKDADVCRAVRLLGPGATTARRVTRRPSKGR